MTDQAIYEIKSLDGFTATQLFSRVKMGLLWNNKRDLFSAGQRKMLKSLWDNKHKGTLECKTPVVYKLKGKVGELGYGRYYGNLGSLEQIERDIRATLCSELYWDIDIVNCHPVLAIQMCKRDLNKDMPMLEYYVKHRKEIITKFMGYGLSESESKNVIIELINGGKLQAKNDDKKYIYPDELRSDSLVISIMNEVKELVDDIIASNLHSELYKHCVSQKENVRGSFISNIYQREERKCLDVIVSVCNAMTMKVDVLAYDGCMVRKDGSIKNGISSEVLREFERAVKHNTGYVIELKVKPMDDEVIPLEELNENSKDGYEALKLEWERTHYYFAPTGTIVEQREDSEIHFTIQHATEVFNNWVLTTTDNEGNPLSFLQKWRKDPLRRMVWKKVYKQTEDCDKSEASVFRGFHYKRTNIDVSDNDREKYISLFKNLIQNVAGNEENSTYQHLLKCFAFKIQHPFNRPDVCIILRSKTHGVGKETLVNIVKRCIGKNTAHYISDEAFWDKHDTCKEGALIIHLEEAGMSNKKMADALKARITADVMNIRPCGLSKYDVDNVALYIMTTNKDCPVKMEESDRRYFIINCVGNPNANPAYWENVYSIIKTEAFIKVIGEYLESIDLKEFRPRNFPMTEYKENIMSNSKSSEVQFLEEGWKCPTDGEYIAEIYTKYRLFCEEREIPYKKNANSFAMSLIDYSKYFTKNLHITTRRAVYLKTD